MEYLSGAAGEKIGSDVRVAVFGRLQRLSLAFHDRNRTGDLVERLTSDVERLQEALVAAFEIMLTQLLAIVGMAVVLLAVDIELGLAALGALPVLACLAVVCERRIRRAERRTRALTGNLAGRATEVLHNVAAVQAFSRASDEERQFRAASDATMASAVGAIELEARIYPLTDLVLSAGTGLVLFVGILRMIGGALPVGTLLVVLAYVSHLSAPIEELAEFATLAARGRAGAECLAEILGSDEVVADAPDAIDAPQGPAALCLRGVSFAYRAGAPALGVLPSLPGGGAAQLRGSRGPAPGTLGVNRAYARDPLLTCPPSPLTHLYRLGYAYCMAERNDIIGETLFALTPFAVRQRGRDLSLTAVSTLATLARTGPRRLTDLAVNEGVTQPSMTAVVTQLEDLGFAERRRAPGDGRVVMVTITRAGTQYLRSMRCAGASAFTALVDKLGEEDVAALRAALPALRHLLDLAGEGEPVAKRLPTGGPAPRPDAAPQKDPGQEAPSRRR